MISHGMLAGDNCYSIPVSRGWMTHAVFAMVGWLTSLFKVVLTLVNYLIPMTS